MAEPCDCKPVKEGEINTLCSEYGFSQETKAENLTNGQNQPPLSASDYLLSFEQKNSNIKHRVRDSRDGDKEENVVSLSVSSLHLFKHHLTGLKGNRSREKTSVREEGTSRESCKLSTDKIMRLAGERFIEFGSHMSINNNENMPSYSSNLTGISVDDKLDVELVQLFFAVAEEVSQKQTDKACKLLSDCMKLASNIGTPVQRVVFYFAEALAKKIERETGQIIPNIIEDKLPVETMVWSKLKHYMTLIAWYQKLPFVQVIQFAAVQAMLENVKLLSKVHLIDLQIRSGVTWAVMMQSIGKQEDYKTKQLKLTVIETVDKEAAETACNHLQKFAKSLDLSFSYKIIFLLDIEDLTEEQFELESDEIVVAYASLVLRTMLARPICLERLMKIMSRINPSMMVVIEVEANHNSPSFISRFIEAFFYFGAFFDSLEDCMQHNDQDRMDLEARIFRGVIHNIVATEGTERMTRSVKFEVWRAYFERFGMVEAELSKSSLDQAQLVFQTFPYARSCNLGNMGKGLLVGWKGTPIFTLSAWRFH